MFRKIDKVVSEQNDKKRLYVFRMIDKVVSVSEQDD